MTPSSTTTIVSGVRVFPAIYRLFLTGQLTRLRSAGLGLLSALSILLAIVARGADDPLDTATSIMAEYGLGIVVPLCAVWIGTGLVGDLIEDRLLVYLWLKPVPLWTIPAGAVAATVTIMVPFVIVPLTVAAAISNDSGLVIATLSASGLAVLAYGAIFVALSTRINRALLFGLGYVVVWENALARIGNGTARLAIRSYALSILERGTDIPLRLADRAAWSSYVIPLTVCVAAVAFATRALARRDID